jgi:hypothetical protein
LEEEHFDRGHRTQFSLAPLVSGFRTRSFDGLVRDLPTHCSTEARFIFLAASNAATATLNRCQRLSSGYFDAIRLIPFFLSFFRPHCADRHPMRLALTDYM